MLYTLVVIFLAKGALYIEQRHLTLQHCAGQAALARMQYNDALPQLDSKIGPVQYRCYPELVLSK